MRETINVKVVGKLWLPQCPAAQEYDLTIGQGPFETDIEPTQGGVESWIATHTGDFSIVEDYQAEIRTPIEPCEECGHARFAYRTIGWADEESEFTFMDCMYQED